MKNYKFPAAAFIGWIRICRPGSILGPQQQFLISKEKEMFALPSIIIIKALPLLMERLDLSDKKSDVLSDSDKKIAIKGDIGQGEGLMQKKHLPESKSPPKKK